MTTLYGLFLFNISNKIFIIFYFVSFCYTKFYPPSYFPYIRSLPRRVVMPPSGFSQASVNGAVTFVRECFNDLIVEVSSGKHTNFKEGLTFEINQISSALTSNNCSDLERGSLLLVQSVYRNALERIESGDADDVAIDNVITRLATTLKQLHITPQGQLVKR